MTILSRGKNKFIVFLWTKRDFCIKIEVYTDYWRIEI